MFCLKKGITIFLCLLLVLGLTACSKIDPDYGVASKPQNTKAEDKKVEISDKIMSLDKVMPSYFDISLFDEENYSKIYLGKNFQINAKLEGDLIPVPAELSDMQAIGWDLAEGNEYDENSLVFAYETIDSVFVNEKGIKLKAQFYNSSRSSVKLSECNIVKFKIDNNFYKNSKKYAAFNVNGITNTMAVTDVIDVLGTPSHFYAISETNYYLDYFISKRDRRNGITVYVNPVDDNVTAVEFSYYK